MDIRLYDYQEDMKKRIMEEFDDYHSIMVQMPTGTGKTHLLAAIVADILAKKESARKVPEVWIIAHRRELVSQIKDTLHSWVDEDKLNQVKVMSIQWLSLHYTEMPSSPSMIVIDEAHHALAESYSTIMNAFPDALKLGLTATPCRLNRKGFRDLFDKLVTSYTILEFIKKGYLSCFDYLSIRPDCEDQKLIDSLKKRGANGDYQIKEMGEVLNTTPSIERLFQAFIRHAKNRKGIVYAIDTQHANHIAEYYCQHGIQAAAIDCHTPSSLRNKLIERFKNTSLDNSSTEDQLQVLVNVDIFSEGFDCPDVEFIQLARPTLSLARYLQMVGRGLRKVEGKDCCVILDQVGLYKRFGLPIMPWDWQGLFKGNYFRKRILDYRNLLVKGPAWQGNRTLTYGSDDAQLMMVLNHQKLDELVQGGSPKEQKSELDGLTIVERHGDYAIVQDKDQFYGIASLKDNSIVVMPKVRKKVTISPDDTVLFRDRLSGNTEFYDLRSGYSLRFWDNRSNVSIVTCGSFSLLKMGKQHYITRTKDIFTSSPLEEKDIEDHGFYLTLHDRRAKYDMLVCLIANDEEQYYWLVGTLKDGGIYVMDNKQMYWHVTPDANKVPVDGQKIRKAFLKGTAKSFVNYSALGKQSVPVKIGSKWGLKDQDGKWRLAPICRNIVQLNESYFAFENLPGQWGIINAAGWCVIPSRYSKITMQDDGTAILVSTNGQETKVLCL